MNKFEEPENLESRESQVDRLVDGEMCEADRRALLLQFEHEPDGWRRCALAFLEAQCWKQELGLAVLRPAAESDAQLPSPAIDKKGSLVPRWRQRVATMLSMGACFLIALVLGMALRGPAGHNRGNSSVSQTVLQTALPSQSATQAVAGPKDNWELVTVAADSPSGQVETFRVPAVHRDTLDESMLAQYSGAMPPEVERAFQASGHQVVQQREIVPVQMKDGHRLMVPVDHVEIHYVGRGSL